MARQKKDKADEVKKDVKKNEKPIGKVLTKVLEEDKPSTKRASSKTEPKIFSAPRPIHAPKILLPMSPPPPSVLATTKAPAKKATKVKRETSATLPTPIAPKQSYVAPQPIMSSPLPAQPTYSIKTPAVPISSSKKTIAVFIDLDNTLASVDNLTELFSVLRGRGHISYAKVYGYTDDKVNEFEEFIAEYRIKTAGKMRFKTEGANMIDTRLIVEAIRVTQETQFSEVFIWAGIGDMIPLFTMIKDSGASILTVDMPIFDVNNKFVDKKIKLYSPHPGAEQVTQRPTYTAPDAVASTLSSDPISSVGVTTPPPSPAIDNSPAPWLIPEGIDLPDEPEPTASDIDPYMIGDTVIPQLPRKRNAPAFGEKEGAPRAIEEPIEMAQEDIDNAFGEDGGYNPLENPEFIYEMAMQAMQAAQAEEQEQTSFAEGLGALSILPEGDLPPLEPLRLTGAPSDEPSLDIGLFEPTKPPESDLPPLLPIDSPSEPQTFPDLPPPPPRPSGSGGSGSYDDFGTL